MTEREEKITVDGDVIEALPNAMFRVQIDNGHVLIGILAGKLRQNKIRVIVGDRVRIEISPYDLNRGRISWRY